MQKEVKFKDLISQQKESGLTIVDFCANHCIATATFHYWKKKLRKKKTVKNDFIPIVVKPESAITTPAVNDLCSNQGSLQEGRALFELVYPNGTVLRIKNDLDLTQLCTLIHLYD